jgi:hypothetical protein
MTTTPNDPSQDAVDLAEEIDELAEDELPSPEPSEREAAVTVDEGALEADDVTMPGDPDFDESHEVLLGEDSDPPPGAAAG